MKYKQLRLKHKIVEITLFEVCKNTKFGFMQISDSHLGCREAVLGVLTSIEY